MKKQNLILSAALAAIFSSSVVFAAEPEVTGKVVHETAQFMKSGQTIGSATGSQDVSNSHGSGASFKASTAVKIYVDGEIEGGPVDGSAYHVEVQLSKDTEAKNYGGMDSYTQRDALREAYIDTQLGDYSIRAGKQQVVWGTADGMKLLDAINPTDYSEMAQNQMEDSRMPVWMVNAENDNGFQFILSEGKSSYIAGLGQESGVATTHTNGSYKDPFIMKGVDLITGRVNGILNVAPALGAVATTFTGLGNGDSSANNGMNQASVNDFMTATNQGGVNQAAGFQGICTTREGLITNAGCMTAVTNNSKNDAGLTGTDNGYAQNLINNATVEEWNAGVANPTQMFHYMPKATFATFNQFDGMTSQYKVDHNSSPTIATRYKGAMDNGLNYSFNIMNGNDTNPYVATHWENGTTGEVLTETAFASGVYTTNHLGSGGSAVGGNATVPVMVMTEKLNRITQIGSSFDTAIETGFLGPIVLRGEALYQKDVMSPVVVRRASDDKDMDHGFLVNSLKMQKGDRFKYVLGADMTAMTNMMVSLQFIQDRNLDYVNTNTATDWKYTADMATMSLTNGLNKGEENKNFGSLFLSKPFGASGEHRWNNIFMFEENGGLWNRFDIEYSIDDDTQATFEVNDYDGNANTQFGQFSESSNIQVGFKHSF
ncbi:DUF1302 domain-containing protein [Candidatus Thioglobus autotrophicus]|uniref:RNA polymerase-associated protein rapA n=1 Tax=Candidatus Thioglobus autotrophicus TaxID=1705394 RepID=UPI00299E5ECE|nr:RNA polymerase-associated protein rapA [Candidatus Thioglobus autotrophicus]WPE18749.1 RNA polymerase-associated protein rapA [Candidatus Thioglobus autotrophicus]